MLRLQKTNYQQVSLVIKRKLHPFNPLIIKAALIAILIHLLFLVFFRISPFHISSTYVFKPIEIKVEQPRTKADTQEEIGLQESFNDFIPENLLLPNLQHIFFNDLTLPEGLKDDHYKTILSLIEDETWPYWKSSSPFILEKSAFQVFISGSLNIFSWHSIHPALQKTIPIHDLYSGNSREFIYDVLVDPQTGKIFSFQALDSSNDPISNSTIEDILRSLIFDIEHDNMAVSGKIKISQFEKGPL